MKLPRKKRDETSAAITQTLGLILACSGLFVLTAYASDPSWWSSPGTGSQSAVVAPQVTTNSTTGVVTTNYIPNDYAAVTQGQLKQFTARAVDYLNANLSGGAGINLNTMVSNWAQDYATNNYSATNNPSAPYKPSDLDAMSVGQLKYVASLVYGRLTNAGYTGLYPSWIQVNTNTDNVVANLGQLKSVFNFDLSLAGPSNLSASANISGTINLRWTQPSTNLATSYSIEQQNINGSWSVIAWLTNTATSFAVTGLSTGENPEFQIIAQNGARVSTAQTTPADPGLIAPSDVNGTSGAAAGEIDLTWQNNSTDATYVIVNESPDGVAWTPIATLPATATFYAVTNLTVGQAYYFGVSAGNN